MIRLNKKLLEVPKGEERHYAYKECYEELTDLNFYMENRISITALVMDRRLDELGITGIEKEKIMSDVMLDIYAQENADEIKPETAEFIRNRRVYAQAL